MEHDALTIALEAQVEVLICKPHHGVAKRNVIGMNGSERSMKGSGKAVKGRGEAVERQ